MENAILTRFKNAWNVFRNKEPSIEYDKQYYRGYGYSSRPDRIRYSRGNEQSIITSVYNRIAIDAAAIPIQHVKLDENNKFLDTVDSELNKRFSLQANIDQTGRSFIQDVVASMLDEGCVAIVPVETNKNPLTDTFKIYSLRTAKILDWYPKFIRVSIYNEWTGEREELNVPKETTAIVENPFYAVMNETNSTMQRLIRKLILLDAVDEQSSSGKMDIIIQLPYAIKSEARKKMAQERREDIETQLYGSKYGVAYVDGTERITQLNRPAENNLLKQVEYLTSMLYSQLCINQSILDGTASPEVMTNYYERTIEPILSAVVDSIKIKFLTKTAIAQKQSISFFRDPFKLVPITEIAEIGDKFTRNEITSPNEIRQSIGMKPSKNPESDELRNRNINQPEEKETITIKEESQNETV